MKSKLSRPMVSKSSHPFPSQVSDQTRTCLIIKSHYENIAISFCSPGPVKTVIIPEALRSPVLLTSILYMAYANLCSLRGYTNRDLALGLKTAAIAHINEKMAHPSTATCTNVIASIAWLSVGTWVRFPLPSSYSRRELVEGGC